MTGWRVAGNTARIGAFAGGGVVLGGLGPWISLLSVTRTGLDIQPWGVAAVALGALSVTAMMALQLRSRTRLSRRWALPIAWLVVASAVACATFSAMAVLKILTSPKMQLLGAEVGPTLGWGLGLLLVSSIALLSTAAEVTTRISGDQDEDPAPVGQPSSWVTGWRWTGVAVSVVIAVTCISYLAANWSGSTVVDGLSPSPTAREMPGLPLPQRDSPPPPASTVTAYGAQTVLPIDGLNYPYGLTVDARGHVYVADDGNNRVVRWDGNSAAQTVPLNTDLAMPTGIAVDTAGTIYVADNENNRVLALAHGASVPTVLPFSGLRNPVALAVERNGTVFVVDNGNNRVLEMRSGATTQTELAFEALDSPTGVAVDLNGTVYVADNENHRIVAMPKGSQTQSILPATDLKGPSGIAVDSSGDLYVAEWGNNRVVKLRTDATTSTVLPYHDLSGPTGISVDSAGNVYVTDSRNDRVVKLPVV